jgi:hypothetical protein
MVGVVTTFYLSYLGYFAFPALGPRFEIPHMQTAPLEGVWLTQAIRDGLDHLELIQRDAFPSGHVGVSLLVLYYARRFLRNSFLPYLVVVGSMGVSTVYLRYHYVVDVLSGVILAVVSGWLAHVIRMWLEGEDEGQPNHVGVTRGLLRFVGDTGDPQGVRLPDPDAGVGGASSARSNHRGQTREIDVEASVSLAGKGSKSRGRAANRKE